MCELCDKKNIYIIAKVCDELDRETNEFYFDSDPAVGLMYCPLCGKCLNPMYLELHNKTALDLYYKCRGIGLDLPRCYSKEFYIRELINYNEMKIERNEKEKEKNDRD